MRHYKNVIYNRKYNKFSSISRAPIKKNINIKIYVFVFSDIFWWNTEAIILFDSQLPQKSIIG